MTTTESTSRAFAATFPAPADPRAGATPLIRVQPDGRCAELVIDTGLPLRSGKTWQAYAKVFCSDVFHAQMMANRLGERLGDAVEQARREAYQQGYRDARQRRRPRAGFSRVL
ncbi:hypothetical protein H5P28_08080 [Ruficoccus amylovorans]|uniref:Uncharacterized protein n=1 Tax=Ruficoccus amylovorans TaxID=1804625 RepID=A0A842HDE6_9BACT|nr:hypothetical protein [Ruficoccus amylovorans]MBC2594219.1 hypothetical protein [Ruficoccus amylovorans]